MRPNVILGAAFSYGPSVIEAFLRSWRRNVETAECHIFVGPGDGQLCECLKDYGAQPVRVAAPDRFRLYSRPRRAQMLWNASRLLVHPALRQHVLEMLVRPEIYRHFVYLRWLRNAGLSPESKVLLTDTRDVFFQADPFLEFDDELGFCEEKRGRSHGECSYNSRWGRQSLGESRFAEIENHDILCAGTILGRSASMIAFLGLFCRTLPKMNMIGIMDQPIINWLVRTQKVANASVLKNAQGPVVTLGSMLNDEITVDFSGRLTRTDGHVYCLLHQYERHSRSQDSVATQQAAFDATVGAGDCNVSSCA